MAMEGRRFRMSRRNWPAFLNSLIAANIWRQLNARDRRRSDARTRWSLSSIAITCILMAWSTQPQALDRFEEARRCLIRLRPGRRRVGRHYQGLIKAARQTGVPPLRAFWKDLRRRHAQRLHTWHGRTVLIVDGSHFDAPRTTANERELGRSGHAKSHPQWQVTLITHLNTGVLWDWRDGSPRTSERTRLREMLSEVPAGTLLVADAGFVGFGLLEELQQRGLEFIIRCGSNATLLLDGTRQRVQDRTVYLWPACHQARPPLVLRQLRFKRGGRMVYLLTNVLEPTRLSRPMASELYRARWGIEVGYRELKQTLDRRKLRARAPTAGRLELAGVVLAWALLRLQALRVLQRAIIRTSLAGVLRVIRRVLEAIRHGQSTGWFRAALRAAVRDHYERRRSKSARDWPHKKNDPPPKPPKHRMLSPSEIQRMHRLTAGVYPAH